MLTIYGVEYTMHTLKTGMARVVHKMSAYTKSIMFEKKNPKGLFIFCRKVYKIGS